MTLIFIDSLSYINPELRRYNRPPPPFNKRGFPLAVAQKDFWLCFAPRFAPLLGPNNDKGKVDPYALAPTQHLYQQDRSVGDPDERSSCRLLQRRTPVDFTEVWSAWIPSIAEFVSSFPFIKTLKLWVRAIVEFSLSPLCEMRLLSHLRLEGATSKHLSELVDLSVKKLELHSLQGENLSCLFPEAGQEEGRLKKTLRRLEIQSCLHLADISALTRIDRLLELRLASLYSLEDLYPISKLNELRVLHVDSHYNNIDVSHVLHVAARLEFLLELEMSCYSKILNQHIKKIATIATIEVLELYNVTSSEENLALLLDPENLPYLSELRLFSTTPALLEKAADSGVCVNLEEIDIRLEGDLGSTHVSVISKKFPNLKHLFLYNSSSHQSRMNFEHGTDFAPLGDLIHLSELSLSHGFIVTASSSYLPPENIVIKEAASFASLESAVSKLVNLKVLEFKSGSPKVDLKKMLSPLRKLERLTLQKHYDDAETTDQVLDLVEEGLFLPVLSHLRCKTIGATEFDVGKNFPVTELLEDRRKQREEQAQKEQEQQEQEQQEFQVERREREDFE